MEIIKYSNEYLPHVVRLNHANEKNIDAKVDYYRQKFAMYRPEPERSCILAKGSDELLAYAHLVSFESLAPGLVFVDMAVKDQITEAEFSPFWAGCCTIAHSFVSGPLRLRARAPSERAASLLAAQGLEKLGQQHELHANLKELPVEQNVEESALSIQSLGSHPELSGTWLATFNKGVTAFWDVPMLDEAALGRMFKVAGFDPSAFHVGFAGKEAVAAQFFSVIDGVAGVVRLNHTAVRSRAHGRRMLKSTLTYLVEQGFSEAVIFADGSSQAGVLLYKLLGFQILKSVGIYETTSL